MPISYLPHISCTPLKICTSQQDSPVSRTVFTLFFLFFGRPSLSISDQDWGRDFMVELDSIAGQLLVTLVHISRSVQRNKTVQFPKQFSHPSLCFLVDQDHHRSRLWKRLYGRNWLHWGAATSNPSQTFESDIRHPSLVHNFVQLSTTVQFPKQISNSYLRFSVDQVLTF